MKPDFRVVVIGAGMAGMLAAIKLKEMGCQSITLYEKADRVGGTWRENTYPGLTCDVPSHHYTYSFARNPNWTRHLSPGAEIQRYFEAMEKKFCLHELIEFNSEVVNAEFQNGRWQLLLSDGRCDKADVVIAATGVLHAPAYPCINGMAEFEGALFHSARWDHDVELQGKRVAVIGMGSTGVQIVSKLVEQGVNVSHFVRNPQWIMPVENGRYSEQQRAAFRADPNTLNEAMDFEGYADAVNDYTQALTKPDSQVGTAMAQACRDNLHNSVTKPALQAALLPDHEPLCKRLIFSADYYQAIQADCATLVRDDIERIEANGIRTADGVLYEVDVIALATGFQADQFMRPMTIIGRNGVTLEKLWAQRPVAYLAVSMPDMPNFFLLNGPNGPVGNFSLIDIAEHQWAYIAQLIEKVHSGEVSELCPTHAALAAFDEERIAAAKKTIWYTGGCQSWYLDAQGIPASWPWTYSRFVEEMSEPKWANFEAN